MEMLAVSLPATVTPVWELEMDTEKSSGLVSTTSSSSMETSREAVEEGEAGMVSREDSSWPPEKSDDTVGSNRE